MRPVGYENYFVPYFNLIARIYSRHLVQRISLLKPLFNLILCAAGVFTRHRLGTTALDRCNGIETKKEKIT